MSNEVFYVAKVGHNELPVTFKLTSCSDKSARFENSSHDFPRVLEYTLERAEKERAEKLTVYVSDGKDKGFSVHFDRG